MTLDQKGNATFIGLMFLMSIAFWALLGIEQEASLSLSLKKRLRTYICAKTLNGETKVLVRRMEVLNRAIMVANAASLNPATAAAAKVAKKAAQVAQQGAHGWFYKRLYDLHSGHCLFGPKTYLTPYKHKGLLKRDALGTAQLRNKKWTQKTLSDQVILDTEFKQKGASVELETDSYEIQAGISLLKSL